jgi:glycerophosphoryl diester phosphodiesterase
MKILSHRGYWKSEDEKNTKIAFERSFQLGFGTETDIRDLNGELVISHDPPTIDCQYLTVANFFKIYKIWGDGLQLALNIKSDGLQKKLMQLIIDFNITNYFVFDMSIPDTIGFIKNNTKFFTRQSEYEIDPAFYTQADGVWLDEFNGHWIDDEVIQKHIKNGKKVCIVSPELHKRAYNNEWDNYKNIFLKDSEHKISICTDLPEKANFFLNEN